MMRLAMVLLYITCAVGLTQETAKPENAKITFYRNHNSLGEYVKPDIFIDGEKVAIFRSGTYFRIDVKPGKHNLKARFADAIVLDFPLGSEMYFFLNKKGRLIPKEEADAKSDMSKLKPLQQQDILVKAETH
jgi:uncharacterized protein DUF2846